MNNLHWRVWLRSFLFWGGAALVVTVALRPLHGTDISFGRIFVRTLALFGTFAILTPPVLAFESLCARLVAPARVALLIAGAALYAAVQYGVALAAHGNAVWPVSIAVYVVTVLLGRTARQRDLLQAREVELSKARLFALQA